MNKYIREPFPALSHLLGAALSVAALISLIEKSGNSQSATVASAIFGVSLILLYVASALTHGLHCSVQTAAHFERCDHAAIFFLIAGTYTPVCLLIIRGPLGWSLLGLEWTLALAGIYSIFQRPGMSKPIRVGIYLAMGWLFMLALGPIISAVSESLLAWLFGGTLFYSVGSVFFVTNRPMLWQGFFDAHDLWHVFVLGGSVCHYVFVSRCLLTLAA